MTLPPIAALLGLSLAATPGVQQRNEHPEVCATYARIDVPAADLPTAADRQRLMGCDSERLYFGKDAWRELEKAADAFFAAGGPGTRERIGSWRGIDF
jgi:hypothetical protein